MCFCGIRVTTAPDFLGCDGRRSLRKIYHVSIFTALSDISVNNYIRPSLNLEANASGFKEGEM